MRRERTIWLGVAVWLGAVGIGFAGWHSYEVTPGAGGRPGNPAGPNRGEWELVLFVHPHCPCSRASLAELAEIVPGAPTGVVTEIAFVCPPTVPAMWERGQSWDSATRMAGVRVRVDGGGAAARRAGATTSGCVVLTAPDGRVAFRGGITRARGRAGDNPGRRAILALLHGDETAERELPVFGCPLFAAAGCDGTGGESCRR
ncbi:MAG: hypothetical protein JWO38_5702 [Gemmataceae bacterium]|nr:hypothetical protein [Gemmataceae bacterium]